MPPVHWSEHTLDRFLVRVGDSSPEPGAGAAAALVAAAAAGLVEMAARATPVGWRDAPAVVAQAKALRLRLTAAADANTEAYRAARFALAATRVGGAGEQPGRLEEDLTAAAERLVDVASAAADTAVLAADAAERCLSDLRPDVVAAIALATGAVHATAVLARTNLVAGSPTGPVEAALVLAERACADAQRRVLGS
jgi:formiminotetrahydrofolate cyclodeaminase